MSSNVVITSMGVRSAIGSAPKEILQNLRSLSSGIRPHRLDDCLDLWFGKVEPLPGDDVQDATKDFAASCADAALATGSFNTSQYLPERLGILMGSSKGRLGNLIGRDRGDKDGEQFQFRMAQYSGDTLGLELARDYGFGGPVLNYPAACATGLTCIIPAIHLLRDGEIDAALAGSAEASGKALLMASFLNMGAISDELMLPFHRKRKGFNPGEGAACFLLEREEDAMARGVKPLARIVAWDFRGDAHHFTAADPSGNVVIFAIRRTLERAGWEPRDVDYINVHGTGTQLNDQVEASVIATVFGNHCPALSSLKPYVGHLLGASASVELALALIATREGFCPPTLGLDEPDAGMEQLNFVPESGLNRRVERMLKLSLGFGGHIAVLAVEVLNHGDR